MPPQYHMQMMAPLPMPLPPPLMMPPMPHIQPPLPAVPLLAADAVDVARPLAPCWYWRASDGGGCERGDGCRFAHA